MKFKELPEGLYQITGINRSTHTVSVQLFENPDGIPLSLFIPEPIEVVHDGRTYSTRGYSLSEPLGDMGAEYKTFNEARKERKARGARYSHVTRRLNAKEPLKGKTLELALDLVGDGNTGDRYRDGIAKKLINGQQLSDYEHHLMVDVFLVHARLAQ